MKGLFDAKTHSGVEPGHRPGQRRHFILSLLGAAPLSALPLTSAAQSGGSEPQTVLVVGDSMSAEYGLRRGSGWVALLDQRLGEEKIRARVVNASISGDTTSGGRSRLAPLLRQHRPQVVVIELGGNDALRGLPIQMTEDNLRAMVAASRDAGARVLLVGMQVPPNYGAAYTQQFAQVFEKVARDTQSGWVPFLLKGVADGPDATALFQADRIHPKEEAHPKMLANVWPALRKLLK